MDDESVFVAELLECTGDQLEQAAVRDSNHLSPCAGRIGEGTEQVHNGGHAELATDRANVLHGRVQQGREHEDDARVLEDGRHLLRSELNGHTERSEYIGAPAFGRERAVTVFCDVY